MSITTVANICRGILGMTLIPMVTKKSLRTYYLTGNGITGKKPESFIGTIRAASLAEAKASWDTSTPGFAQTVFSL